MMLIFIIFTEKLSMYTKTVKCILFLQLAGTAGNAEGKFEGCLQPCMQHCWTPVLDGTYCPAFPPTHP